jgi:2-oxoglutarate ferredoxin oxidoreductase subunit alpha
MARIARSVINKMGKDSKNIGLIRPISLWPFPEKAFLKVAKPSVKFLAMEMSYGQMVEDVRLAVNGRSEVEFMGRAGGGIPTEDQLIRKIKSILK